LSGPSTKLKEYFSRANEINYFPCKSVASGHSFEFHVTAYSGVGQGARFKVDLENNGSVEVVRGDDGSLGHNADLGQEADKTDDGDLDHESDEEEAEPEEEEGEPEEEGADPGEQEVTEEVDEILFEEDSDDPETVDELYLEESVESYGLLGQNKKLKSTNGTDVYNFKNMVTGVKVERVMGLGDIRPSRPSRISKTGIKDIKPPKDTRKDVLARGIRMLATEAYSTYSIQDGQDDNVAEYKLADDYAMPECLIQEKGWARRAERGDMYGQKYIEKYKDELFDMYKRGSDDSDRKQGPSGMLEQLQRAHPAVYTLPNFTEIQSFVNQCFAKEKTGKTAAPAPGRMTGSTLSAAQKETVLAIVHRFGGQIKPLWVYKSFARQFPAASAASEKEVKSEVTKLATKTSLD
jgi:hypothetical protein